MPGRRELVCGAAAAWLVRAAEAGEAEHEAWKRDRLARLTRDDGYLTLTGLHWLEPGANRIETAPGLVFHRHGQTVRFESPEAVAVNGKPGRAMALRPDEDKLTIGTRTLFVIRRGDRVAIRERDTASRFRREFAGIEAFPFRAALRIEATWHAYPKPVKRRIGTVAGTVDEYEAPGQAEFTLGGRTLRLEPVIEDDHLFYVFKDRTAGKSTYPAGRFMEMPMPSRGGPALVDFNRAYNPPCAFTPYATCPLPLKHNQLAVAIEAGERAYHFRGPDAAAGAVDSSKAGHRNP